MFEVQPCSEKEQKICKGKISFFDSTLNMFTNNKYTLKSWIADQLIFMNYVKFITGLQYNNIIMKEKQTCKLFDIWDTLLKGSI